MQSFHHRVPLVLMALVLAGCGAQPAGTLAATRLAAPKAAVAQAPGQQLAPVPSVTMRSAPAESVDASAIGGADPRSADEEQPIEPRESDDTGLEEPLNGEDAQLADEIDPNALVETRAYAVAARTNANGEALVDAAIYREPVYLTPNYFPVIIPGGPTALAPFTPRTVDLSKVPTDAFVELVRLGRLRTAKRTFWSFLFGYSFPKITVAEARDRLATNQEVYLSPDGGYFHFDRTYKKITDALVIDAMLEQLQQDALTREAQAAREANINSRAQILPGFNNTYDIVKFLVLESVISGYSYNGSPVRRCLVAAANFHESTAVRKEVATFWESNPNCTASQLRQASCRILSDKFRKLAANAAYLAERPSVYGDAQNIPGLRDPRPVEADGDRTFHDLDVEFNKDVIRDLALTGPLLLSSTVYP
jgi:hypothetical protein